MPPWNVNALPWIVVGIALLVLAAVVFRRQRASRVALLFCWMIGLVAVWFGGFAGMLLARTPASIYDFTVTALRLGMKRRPVRRGIYTVAVLFALVTIFTNGVIGSIQLHSWGWYPVAGPMLGSFLVFFFGVLFGQLTEGLIEQRRATDHKRRHRIGQLMLIFAVVYFAAIDFLPMFGAPWPPFGYVPVVAFVIIAWTSIRRHRLPAITAQRAAREILDTMADALFVIDAEAKIRVINGAAMSLLGFQRNELLGRSIDSLEHVEGEKTISRTLQELASRGPIRDQERTFRRSHGEPLEVSVSISPISEHEVQEGAVVIARDIRERKRADADMRE